MIRYSVTTVVILCEYTSGYINKDLLIWRKKLRIAATVS